MRAIVTGERNMAAEGGDRMAKLESEVGHIRSDVHTLQSDVRSLQGDVKHLTGEFYSFKVEVAREFGLLRNEISKAKVWMLCTGISTVLGVAAVVGLKGH
jgi:hypothetical protein